MQKNTVIRLNHIPPPGLLQKGVFDYVEEPLPEVAEGQILVENLMICLDAGSRGQLDDKSPYPRKTLPGETPISSDGIIRVMESRHPDWAAGDIAYKPYMLFQSHEVIDVEQSFGLRNIPEDSDIPLDAFMGVLGIVGFTAYVGLLFIGQPEPGETVLVSAAAGATGSTAVQIARITGCNVVGIAGGQAKCDYVVHELGADACIDYKQHDISRAINHACPGGVDVYYENVGGDIQKAAYANMNTFGRMVLCGQIAQYSGAGLEPGPNLMEVVTRRLKILGFLATDHMEHYPAFLQDMTGWYKAGKVKHHSTITEGFENMHEAINSLISGNNIGKQICRLRR